VPLACRSGLSFYLLGDVEEWPESPTSLRTVNRGVKVRQAANN